MSKRGLIGLGLALAIILCPMLVFQGQPHVAWLIALGLGFAVGCATVEAIYEGEWWR